jgi:hypothetical protein
MIQWFSDLLLGAGGAVASFIMNTDAVGFPVLQMMIATLVLAAVVATIVYWRSLLDYWHSHRRRRD